MEFTNSVVAVFASHQAAEAAVKQLTDAGIEMKHLSIAGKGYHTDEKVVGFYNTDSSPRGACRRTWISRYRGGLRHRECGLGWRAECARCRDLQHRRAEGQRAAGTKPQ